MTTGSGVDRTAVARRLAPILYAFVGAQVMIIGIGVLVLFDGPGQTWGAAVVAAVAIGALGAAAALPGVMLRPLDAGAPVDPVRSAGAIQSVGMVTLALTESATLIGFAMGFVVGGWLPLLVGGAAGLVGVVSLGPTAMRVSAWVERLESAGTSSGL